MCGSFHRFSILLRDLAGQALLPQIKQRHETAILFLVDDQYLDLVDEAVVAVEGRELQFFSLSAALFVRVVVPHFFQFQ